LLVKLSKTLVVPLAGLLLVGAAGAAVATSGGGSPAPGGGIVPAAASPTPAPSAGVVKPPRVTVLAGVLDGLVAKGTITAAQKAAILDALKAERAARQADRQALRAARQAARAQLRGFLSDGVITKAELDQLPADSPLRQMTSLMDDGKITLDELRALGRGFMKGLGLGGRMGGGIGGGMGGAGAPNASASPASGG
jgi:hypothetical protein